MYKFRSMKVNAENITNPDGSTYNAKDDPRVTKVGKFLRETSLDEMAQVLNMLKCEMSLIGPRASGWTALESYQPDEIDKMKVKPGITGYTPSLFQKQHRRSRETVEGCLVCKAYQFWTRCENLFQNDCHRFQTR